VVSGKAPHKIKILDRRGADDNTLDSGIEQNRCCLDRADTATRLNGHIDRLSNGRDDVTVLRDPGAGGVEVNHMDPTGSRFDKGDGLGHWIVAVDGLPAVVALVETNTAPAADIDCRK
jgi:hypothetical protein